MAEENFQRGVVCALRIREATFSLEKIYLYLTEAVEWMKIDVNFQRLDLNLLIPVPSKAYPGS